VRIGLVSNRDARGLSVDAELLTDVLQCLGHDVTTIQFDEPCDTTYDLLIFLEVCVRSLIGLSLAPPWLVINPEFLHRENTDLIRSTFGYVLCKTKAATEIGERLFGQQAIYTGFIARDRLIPEATRSPVFLHIAGRSSAKGTMSVIDAWRWRRNGKSIEASLIIVADRTLNLSEANNWPQNVLVMSDLTDEEMQNLQNVCRFHLQPSETEGFGHVLRESMSVNAILLTTDAPPMNEIDGAFLIPGKVKKAVNYGTLYETSALDIHLAAQQMLSEYSLNMPQADLRSAFLAERSAFIDRIGKLISTVDKQKPQAKVFVGESALNIAFIGNFGPSESTENLMLDALTRGLNHSVTCLQENELTIERLQRAALLSDVLLWVRTPGYLQIADSDMLSLFAMLKKQGTTTLSLHLDKFWGIKDREELIGKIPFWRSEFCGTADGGNQAEFERRGVNHFWMQPAMSEMYLHPGRVRENYRCKVGFVGARDYHSEYPFRRQMIDFLEKHYGEDFKLITGGVRGHELNDVYASTQISVADCFAAGSPNYFSDRLPESTGRGAFVIHPDVPGMTNPVITYEPQNLASLHAGIQFMLGFTAEERQKQIERTMDHVRENDTWTRRLRDILKMVRS
jgi:hypothetical protein